MNYILTVLSGIKVKLLVGVVLILATLLTSSLVVNHFQNNKYLDLVQTNATTLVINTGLSSTITSLRQEIKTMPDKHITTVKDIDMELCKGLLGVKDILNLPPTTVLDVYPVNPNSKEAIQNGKKNEKPYVDIDAPLPPSLIKLLNEE